MAIRSVVTRGYGSGGSVPLVVLRGFLAGGAPPEVETLSTAGLRYYARVLDSPGIVLGAGRQQFMDEISGLISYAGTARAAFEAEIAAMVGIVFGLPSLRVRGFYLAASTLATQFFVVWALTKIRWFTNYSSSGVITAQQIEILGYHFDTPASKYLLVLGVVSVLALAAKNMVRSNVGRCWMAIRDMDVAAEVIGIRQLHTKLLAFAVSSFFCGVAGALYAYAYLGTVEPEAYSLDLSFRILFMVVIGGLGSILGSFLGAGFIVLLPIALNQLAHALQISTAVASNVELMMFGALIIFFLIVEPHGLARLWQIGKEKLRLWPFPH
jgi:branched-chain amino acid transport system permease protein